jgi:LPXTG-motif cell wall-anchored protein
VGSNEWQKLERNADVTSFVIPNGIANVQVKVVDGDSTSLLFGQVQTTGLDSQSGGNADGGSTTIWWLLGGLLLVIIAGVVLQRRQAS